MKNVKMLTDNLCKKNADLNAYVIRSGIWNHMEIVLYREEFESNDSNYELMVDILERLFEGEIVDLDNEDIDLYSQNIMEQLVAYNVIKEIKDSDLKPAVGRTLVIVEDEFIKLADAFKNDDEVIVGVDHMMSFFNEGNLLSAEYLQKNKVLIDIKEYLSDYKQLKVILSKPKINFLENINRTTLSLDIPWCVAYIDRSIATFASFNSKYTACFECLEQHNSIRMDNYVSYLNYKKEENIYVEKSISKSDFMFLNALLNKINDINHYDISSTLEGKIISIYLPNFEIYSENMMRSPICQACGYISVEKATNYNARTENIIAEILADNEQVIL